MFASMCFKGAPLRLPFFNVISRTVLLENETAKDKRKGILVQTTCLMAALVMGWESKPCSTVWTWHVSRVSHVSHVSHGHRWSSWNGTSKVRSVILTPAEDGDKESLQNNNPREKRKSKVT